MQENTNYCDYMMRVTTRCLYFQPQGPRGASSVWGVTAVVICRRGMYTCYITTDSPPPKEEDFGIGLVHLCFRPLVWSNSPRTAHRNLFIYYYALISGMVWEWYLSFRKKITVCYDRHFNRHKFFISLNMAEFVVKVKQACNWINMEPLAAISHSTFFI